MKFKVGDKIKVVSHKHTIKRFNGDSDNLVRIGTECVVNNVCRGCVGVEGNAFLLDTDDVVSLDTIDIVDKEQNLTQNELLGKGIESKGIESDGGSSSYYFTKLPQHLIDKIVETGGIEIKDIVRYVYDNDADAFNIVKAQKRIIEYRKGKGKEGIDMLYDANKIKFFAEEQYNSILQEGKE